MLSEILDIKVTILKSFQNSYFNNIQIYHYCSKVLLGESHWMAKAILSLKMELSMGIKW